MGTPFTASNNSLGAIGGGIQEEYGPMNVDVRSSAAISGTWNIDYFHGDNNIVKEVVNGWQISPILILHSGGVFTVTTGNNKSLDSIATLSARIMLSPASIPCSTITAAAFAPRRPGRTRCPRGSIT